MTDRQRMVQTGLLRGDDGSLILKVANSLGDFSLAFSIEEGILKTSVEEIITGEK